MQENETKNHNFQHLVKTAYALADSLACTHEIEEIYIPQKDMSLKNWIEAMRHLLAQIDTELVQVCGIPIFRLGLHPKLSASIYNSKTVGNVPVEIPQEMQEAVSQFGQAFDQVAKDIWQGPRDVQTLPGTAPDLPAEIINLARQMVDLILNDLGFKGKDFDQIY
jgi:hypothetical protein